jgi:membrane protease YdiL (CAAX protease family)
MTIVGLFVGEDGKLRFFWRAILFIGLGIAVERALQPLYEWIVARYRIDDSGLSATSIALGETGNFLIAFIPTALFALYERRSIGSYGMPIAKALSPNTFEGFLVGIVFAGAVAIGMLALGGMQVHGLALTGGALALSGLAWLAANVIVGIAEELWFRGYLLRALWRSVGFWPASLTIATLFAAIHYFFKPGENIWDVITLVAFSLLCCFTVLRTGNLWFAVGFHAAFDFMQFFVIGTPNGTLIPKGRMLDVTFNGPAWINGGVLGTEASVLMYPMFVLTWLYVWWRHRPAIADTAVSLP